MSVPSVNVNGTYDNGASGNADAELALGMRNVTVEGDYEGGQNGYRHHQPGQSHPVPQVRPPPHQVQYNPYRQQPGDYTTYYNGTPTADPYNLTPEYPYMYDQYRTSPDPSVYGSPLLPGNTGARSMYVTVSICDLLVLNVERRPAPMYYTDFPGSPRPPAAQYYYPSPNMPNAHMFPTPNPAHAQLAAAVAATSINDKKREMQVSYIPSILIPDETDANRTCNTLFSSNNSRSPISKTSCSPWVTRTGRLFSKRMVVSI